MSTPSDRVALDEDFLAAADTLVRASHLLRAGDFEYAARLASDAVELALKALIPLPVHLQSGSGRKVNSFDRYAYRRKEAQRRFGIRPIDLRGLHGSRLVERFREDEEGRRRLPTEAESEIALRTADEMLRRLTRVEEVPPSTATRVLERLSLETEPSLEEELLDLVEHQVGWGHYDSTLKTRLIYLDRLLGTRTRSKIGRGHHTRVLTLRAHAAMNLTKHDGPEGAIELARQAAERWEVDHQNRARVIHTLTIQSISLRNKGLPRLAIPLMERAAQVAGDDPELIDSVDSERAAILLALGDPDGAARLVRDALDRRRAQGDPLGEADYLRPTGKALMRAGELIQAELALRRAQELTPPDYLMAQCVLAVSLTELYAVNGDKREAHRWAEAARHLIEHRGYKHQGQVLGEIIRRFPHIW